MSGELVKAEKLQALERAAELGITAHDIKGRFEKAFTIASAVQQLKDALTDEVIRPIMALQGTSIGFRTDKDRDGGYPAPTVRNCLIDATMRGLYPVGNHWNIIGGNCYITKEGMGHLLSQIKGLSYSITPGVPHMTGDKGATVKMTVEFVYNGKQERKELDICTRLNAGMGSDAVIGKATRKTRAWLFQHISGIEIPDGESDDVAIDTTATPVGNQATGIKDKLKKQLGKPEVDPATGEQIPMDFAADK